MDGTEMGDNQTESTNGLPRKAVNLARRVSRLKPERVAVRYQFDVTLMPDGSWWLDVERKKPLEYLGNE